MPWKVDKMENLKQKFIVLYEAGAGSMTDLCRQFGISRPTGYAIVKRYEQEGCPKASYLSDRSLAEGRF